MSETVKPADLHATPIDLDEIDRQARAAAAETPGWWRRGAIEKYHVFCQCDDALAPIGRVLLKMNTYFPHEATAAFIAAASPDVVIALTARVRELEAGLLEACKQAARGPMWGSDVKRLRAVAEKGTVRR